MKVLLINSVCGRQSTGRIVTDIKRELIKQGHECVIAYGEAASIADEDDYHIGSEIERYIHAAYARMFDGMGYGSVLATLRFIKWIEQYDPDVINLHNIHGYYINIVILFRYLKKSRAKIVWTFHDCWPFTGHSALCDAKKCERWKTSCFKCPMKSEYPKSFFDFSSRNYQTKKNLFTGIGSMTIVTPSKWLKSCVEYSFLRQYDVKVINNGIDFKVFHRTDSEFRKKLGVDDKFLLLGVASVWNDLKGFNDFCSLSQKIDDRFCIVLVGLSDEQMKKIPSNIIGIKNTDSVGELVKIYSGCDLFLNLTYCDNFPTVNLESLACGTPVLTYQTGGSPETLSKENGIVVPVGAIDQVVSEVVRVKESYQYNHWEVSESVNLYSYSNMISNYLNLFLKA